MAIAIVMILVLPRKYVVAPVLLTLFLFPQGQVIVLAGVHLNAYRIIILFGLARWLISARSSPLVGGFNFMDRLCTFFFLSYFVINSLLYSLQSQALIKNSGDLLDGLGCYILIRFLIRDREDIQRTIKVLAAVALASALSMLYEQRTGANPFALLGGMPLEVTRDGKVRSQAVVLRVYYRRLFWRRACTSADMALVAGKIQDDYRPRNTCVNGYDSHLFREHHSGCLRRWGWSALSLAHS